MSDGAPSVPDLNPPLQPSQHASLFDEVSQLVTRSGGVGGVVQQFEEKGLGKLVSSWVSNGANSPMMGEEVLQVLGKDRVMGIAAKAGLSEAQVAAGISQILPKVIDGLTPNGTTPVHARDDLQEALGMLKSRFLGNQC